MLSVAQSFSRHTSRSRHRSLLRCTWMVGALTLASCTAPPEESRESGLRALVIVDMQYDFLPGGALAVEEGDQILGLINRLQSEFDLVVATQDWHPEGHGSFASSHPGRSPGDVVELDGLDQVLWPDHAVQGTHGAALSAALDQDHIARVFQKGSNPNVDSYSGFFDNGQRGDTGLNDYLKSRGVTDVYVVGLALDYCVKFTALDAQRLGFDTTLIADASRAVNLLPGDGDDAIAMMEDAGIRIASSASVLGAAAQ